MAVYEILGHLSYMKRLDLGCAILFNTNGMVAEQCALLFSAQCVFLELSLGEWTDLKFFAERDNFYGKEVASFVFGIFQKHGPGM